MPDFILHSDLNCFYAGVEINEHPELKGKCVAVCGSTENRHGIVLAKSYEAKKYGVKTGQTNADALKACPQLIVVHPHYELYLYYSRLVRSIYARYSRFIEPFGMDENWILLPSLSGIDRAEAIAQEIRETVKNETGLTVSVGVSFSKVFAKLGSDMKKPDAVTVISRENYREKVWPLPAAELLYVGPHTARHLAELGIYTIGQLAEAGEDCVKGRLGKNGLMLRAFARGEDGSSVAPQGYSSPIKSVGHGTTTLSDLYLPGEVWPVVYELSQDVNHRLRKNGFLARQVTLAIRYSDLETFMFQCPMPSPTRSPLDIARWAFRLYTAHAEHGRGIRSLTVTAGRLIPDSDPVQQDFFGAARQAEKRRALEDCVDDVRGRFGEQCLKAASLLPPVPMAKDRCEKVTMPALMYR